MSTARKNHLSQLVAPPELLLHRELLSQHLSDTTILVTGAAGSIGSEIVQQLLIYRPKTILLLDIAELPLTTLYSQLKGVSKTTRLVPCFVDIKDEKLMQQVFVAFQPDIVYHAAANKHVPFLEGFPYQAVQNNVFGTRILADLAVLHGVKTFVFVSTDKAVNPSSVMGASKRIAELYLQTVDSLTATTDFIITRFGNVYGSSGSVALIFTDQIQSGGPVTITHPEMERYFMTLTQACELVLESGVLGRGGEIFMFDMGFPIRIVDLANQLIQAAGLVPEVDIRIEWIGVRPGEKLREDLITEGDVLVATSHPRIKCARSLGIPTASLTKDQMEAFLSGLDALQPFDIVARMKNLVPEFRSTNPAYGFLGRG